MKAVSVVEERHADEKQQLRKLLLLFLSLAAVLFGCLVTPFSTT